ncbi:hypothetical protein ACFL10_01055, partial [Patescibacteria group bacterium]
MKKILLLFLVLCFLTLAVSPQLIFAQTNLTSAELAELRNDPNVEIITRPDGTIEVIKKIKIFEEFTIPREIFVRENIGYEVPILDDQHIKSPNEVSRDPFVIGTNALLAILIFLIVGLACFLFNNVLEAHGDEINKFTKKIPILNLFEESKQYKHRLLKKVIIFLFLLLFGLVAAHISPDFNLFEQKNLGILIITVGTIIIATYAKDIIRFVIARRNAWPAFFKPNILGLFLAIGCVILSRTLKIPPGYLFGIPVGLFIVSKQFNKSEGKFEYASLSWMFFMAIVAWFIIPYTKGYEIINDLFNLLFVILLEGVFFELFPLTYLPGEAIFKWSKIAWASIFGSVSFLLLHTL